MTLLNKIANDVSIMKTDIADIQITVARLLTKDTSVMSIRSKMLSLNLPKTSLDELEALEDNLIDSQLEKDLVNYNYVICYSYIKQRPSNSKCQ